MALKVCETLLHCTGVIPLLDRNCTILVPVFIDRPIQTPQTLAESPSLVYVSIGSTRTRLSGERRAAAVRPSEWAGNWDFLCINPHRLKSLRSLPPFAGPLSASKLKSVTITKVEVRYTEAKNIAINDISSYITEIHTAISCSKDCLQHNKSGTQFTSVKLDSIDGFVFCVISPAFFWFCKFSSLNDVQLSLSYQNYYYHKSIY